MRSRSPFAWARPSTWTRTWSARPRRSTWPLPRRPTRSRPTIPSACASGWAASSRRTSRSSTRPDGGPPTVRVALVTNNYLPFRGGVTTSVETLRRGLDARGHEAWVFAPRFRGVVDAHPHIVRYPSLPAATYPEFAIAVPWSRAAAGRARAERFDVFHAHHPFLLGPVARRLARAE